MKQLILVVAFAFISVAISGTRSETETETHSFSQSPLSLLENDAVSVSLDAAKPLPLMVPLTLIQGAASKGAGDTLFLSLSDCFVAFVFSVPCFVVNP